MSKIPLFDLKSFQPDHQQHSAVYVNSLKMHLASHKFINVPHSHETYITVLFTQGHGIHQIDFKSYPVSPGDVFLLSPGQVHSWSLSPDTDGFIFFHTEAYYNSFFQDHKIDHFPFFFLSHNYPLIQLEEELRETENWFTQLYEEYWQEYPRKDFRMVSLINLVYIGLSRKYRHEVVREENENQVRIRKLYQLVDLYYKDKKLPNDYAEMLNMTTRHLGRICHEVTGRTTSDLIHDRILLEAKRLLIHGPDSISLIAYELGYDDVSYFIRFFRKKTGISPKQFRLNRQNATLE